VSRLAAAAQRVIRGSIVRIRVADPRRARTKRPRSRSGRDFAKPADAREMTAGWLS
jgi:hypothetical protein